MSEAYKLYKKTDPESSKAAVYANEKTIKTHREMVYNLLKEHEGLTSSELAVFLGDDRYYWRGVTSRRLADLQNEGFAYQGDTRKCTVSNQLCVTWHTQKQNKEVDQLCLNI